MGMGCFADDPVAFFVEESLYVHHMPLEQQEALQLAALQLRFAAMRDALPPLTALADAAGAREIGQIEDVVALMFPHSLFKSYPHHLLDNLRFAELTEWLSRLTLIDLAPLNDRTFETIDEWMDALDTDTELAILTSSGTSEGLSLLPRGKREGRLLHERSAVQCQTPEQLLPMRREDADSSMLWLSYAEGRSGMLRSAELLRIKYTTPSTKFIALVPGRASTDWQNYMGRLTAPQQGRAPPQLTAYIAARQEEVALIHGNSQERLRTVLAIVRDELSGAPVHMAGGMMMLHRVAEEGLKMGMEPGLGPRSRVSTGGGTKGLSPPPDMESAIKRFAGVDVIYEAYGMTEIGDAFGSCEHGRFHIWPWIVPFVLDEKTGGVLPRHGKQRGRGAFFDLSAQTYWGGVVTGDRVSISWERCSCGRSTPQVLPPVERIPTSGLDAHALGGAAPSAVHAALEALNRGL
jgi:hypothetical protein